MKKTNIFLVALIATVSFAAFSFKAGVAFKPSPIDLTASVINWKGYKVTGEHNGTAMLKSGSLDFAGDVLTGGAFEIDMNSLLVGDLQGGSKTRLENHLKSDDFFGSANFPVAKFKITKVISRGTPGAYKVIGNLTIKETTKEIKFDATLTTVNGKTNATADIRIDRADYNVRYGSGSFFDSLGDKTIYDEFDLKVKLVLQ